MLFGLVLSGCGHGRGETTIGANLRLADDVFRTTPADDECFAAISGVVVVGHGAAGKPSACTAVAVRYFGGRRRIALAPSAPGEHGRPRHRVRLASWRQKAGRRGRRSAARG